MSSRRTELSDFEPEIAWLTEAEGRAVFRHALSYSSKTHYGLNPDVFPRVDRLDVDEPGPGARNWLAERVGAGNEPVLLVFGEREVCTVRASFFLDNWQDMFCPSRDDVIILPRAGGWALFYCHEDEFEFGWGGPVAPIV